MRYTHFFKYYSILVSYKQQNGNYVIGVNKDSLDYQAPGTGTLLTRSCRWIRPSLVRMYFTKRFHECFRFRFIMSTPGSVSGGGGVAGREIDFEYSRLFRRRRKCPIFSLPSTIHNTLNTCSDAKCTRSTSRRRHTVNPPKKCFIRCRQI